MCATASSPFTRIEPRDWFTRAGIWLVLDAEAAAPRSLPEVTEQFCAAGLGAVVCRLKSQSAAELYPLARSIRAICSAYKCPFVMSHHLALGLHLQADAVQLGDGDVSLAQARALAGPQLVLGRSTHSLAEARSALDSGADYVFLGPVYPTPSKQAHGPPLGLATAAQAAQLDGAVVCIGGIGGAEAAELRAVGIRQVAAIRALQAVDDIQAAQRQLHAAITGVTSG
jgi:thiamine-phosphate pyrophosphorylase